jgi:glycosidase
MDMMKRTLGVLAVLVLVPLVWVSTAAAAGPSSVTIAGSFQSELGCPGDWQPACATTHLAYVANDDVWEGTWTIPAGSWEFKAALNDSWDTNYGANAQYYGPNITLDLAAPTAVTFFYDDKTHWVTDNHNALVVTAPGSYQSEIGCSGDWDPSCLRSWLEDPNGDGGYTFATAALPHGSYEVKVAINRSWDENYGQNGVPGGANIPFTVPFDGANVVFRYDATTHVLTISSAHSHDDNVEYAGLRFDSRDSVYRSPIGAVAAGTPVTVRFRTFHDDVTGVTARIWDSNTSTEHLAPMQLAQSGVSCQQSSLRGDTCDYWQTALPDNSPDVLWYRFIITDGVATAYYADDTPALDGGLGAATSFPLDFSYALTVYTPGFTTPEWAKRAIIYQVFPDRFRNADPSNDPQPGTPLYDAQSTRKAWGAKPEGYCAGYDTACNEQPMGRDFFGGDLKGITRELHYIQDAGFNTLYLNPIFWARSNHRYDSVDFYRIDPALGSMNDFRELVQQAHALGMRIILDGVFNHVSSDSPFFDRYHRFPAIGACESPSSPDRDWFYFGSDPGPCAPGVDYYGWSGFDTLPVLNKAMPAVQDYFITGRDSVSKHWLRAGTDGWRFDVMSDDSFPPGYWQTFRQTVKSIDPKALIIGELWQKDTTLLELLRGDAADTTMNYRLRDVVDGLFSPNTAWDPKGFPDSGHSLTPSQAAQRLLSMQEDYAPPAYDALMNLIDSHDTPRALWDLTPGANDPAAKELNTTALADGKQRLRLAALLQFTIPGAPAVYYGDEVGLTGGDDPDNRRTYPWADTGSTPDTSLLTYYTALAHLRRSVTPLSDGDFRVLLADDSAGVLAYGRKHGGQVALVIFNRSATAQTVSVPVAGYVPDGVRLRDALGSAPSINASGGVVRVTIPSLSGLVLRGTTSRS